MSKNKLFAGIDIGTEKICTIIANYSDESDNLNVIGVSSTPSAGLRKSQIVDLEEAINAITDSVEAAERMAGFNINAAHVSISGAHIQSQNSKGVVAVSEPEGEITPHDVNRVIEAGRAVALPSAREIIHVIPRDYTVDAQSGIKDPIGMTGVRLEAEAHLITGSATAMRNVVKCISELGINVQDLVFSGLASSYATLSDTEKELGVVLLDIGAGTTSLTAFVEGAIAYSSVIPIGAKNITNDLAIGMRISLSSAEKIKLYLSQTQKNLIPPKGAKSSEVAKLRKDYDTIDLVKLGIKEDSGTASRKALIEGIIRPRLNEIFNLVGTELKESGVLGNTPAGLVIAGGGADTVSIVEVSKRILSMPARVGIPKGLSGLVDELNHPSFATACGLINYAQDHAAFAGTTGGGRNMFGFFKKIPLRSAYDSAINFVKSLLP
jgi:cell division protein FtsA